MLIILPTFVLMRSVKYISYFFLTAFLLTRVVNVHMGSHLFEDADHETCEVCDLILQTQEGTPLQFDNGELENNFSPTFEFDLEQSVTLYSAPSLKLLLYDYFYNKPPPTTIIG